MIIHLYEKRARKTQAGMETDYRLFINTSGHGPCITGKYWLMPLLEEQKQLERKLLSTISHTSINYGVINSGDRILVAVSGGKDSYGLLYLLRLLKERLPFSIEITACHVSQQQPGFDPSPLIKWLEHTEMKTEIVEQDTYSVVQANTKEGETPCSVCSRMRRGILYTTAKRLGCNKLALGHHREDTLATLVMNLFFSGKIQAMPPKYTTNDGALEVIRPLIEVAESRLIELARHENFPIVPCGLCSQQKDHKRKWVNELLDHVEKQHPDIRNVMAGALKNVRPSHLFDKSLVKKTEDDSH
jgi:tRNA 2-thiocytidine biosynthesis protein TtcA